MLPQLRLFSVDWNSFKITANGFDVTNLVNWTPQTDFAGTEYIENGVSEPSVITDYDIDPNRDWATVQNISDGQATSKANTSLRTEDSGF